MNLIISLFAIGVVLLAIEVVVPGAVLGIAGGISMVIGIVVAFTRYGVDGGLIATGVGVALGAVTLYLEFVLLPKSRLARAFSMTATVEGKSQPPIANRETVVGKRAIAVTVLSPSGYVELAGVRYEAFARSGHALAGEQLDVVDVDNFRLIVSKPPASVSS